LAEDNHRNASVTVEDSGEGIPVEDVPHVFDRFHRGAEGRTTTSPRFGLGLAICKAIIEGCGGTIHLTSASGSGTSVRAEFAADVILKGSAGDIPAAQS
jgi:hypothetical protein